MPERLVLRQKDGVQIVADMDGPQDGPPIVLAHGGGQTRHSWSGAFRRLAEAGYRVINYDARGHGESDWSPNNRYPIQDRWGDMEMVLSAVGEPAAIIGASMGGGSALYGVSRGYRPAALVLVDIAPNSERAGMQRVRNFMESGLNGFASLEEAADAVAAYNTSRPRPDDVSGLKRNLRQESDGRWYWHWDPGMVQLDIDAERSIMEATLSGLRAAEGMPVALVRGLSSDVVTNQTVGHFRRDFPALRILEVEGAGHMVAGDRNDAFNEAVLGFLAEHMPVTDGGANGHGG